MAYCVEADLLTQISDAQLISLTDDNNTGEIGSTIVTQSIADADAEIDGWIGKKYEVPLATVPDLVKKLSIDIALYNLFGRSRLVPEDRKDRYQNAITFLKAVSAGKASLGEDDPEGSPVSATIVTTTSTRVFTRDNLEGF